MEQIEARVTSSSSLELEYRRLMGEREAADERTDTDWWSGRERFTAILRVADADLHTDRQTDRHTFIYLFEICVVSQSHCV